MTFTFTALAIFVFVIGVMIFAYCFVVYLGIFHDDMPSYMNSVSDDPEDLALDKQRKS